MGDPGMGDPGLSRREASVLEAIERSLREDRRLDRAMQTPMPPLGRARVRRAGRRLRGAAVVAAAAGCVSLLAAAVTTGHPALLLTAMACLTASVLLTLVSLWRCPGNE